MHEDFFPRKKIHYPLSAMIVYVKNILLIIHKIVHIYIKIYQYIREKYGCRKKLITRLSHEMRIAS